MNQTHKAISKNDERAEEFEQTAYLENGQIITKKVPNQRAEDINMEPLPQIRSDQAIEAKETIKCSKKKIFVISGVIVVIIALILGLTFGLTYRLKTPQIAQAKLLRVNSQSDRSSYGLFNPKKFYEIEPVSAPGKVLDISMNPYQKLQMIIFTKTNGQNQRFKIIESSPGKYQIIAIFSKDTFSPVPEGGTFAVQVPNESMINGEKIFANQVKNQPNQLWEIIPITTGVYTIKAFSGLVLDVYEGLTADETPLIQYQSHGGINQQFIIRSKQDKCGQAPKYELFNPDQLYQFESILKPGMLLIASLNLKQIFKMIIYERSMTSNERFNIIQVSPGKYQIITTIQGRKYSLQVPCGCNDISRLEVNQVKNQPQQYWEIVPVSNGIYQLKSFYGQVVDVSYSETVNETPIIQHPSHGGKNQQWIIKLAC